MLKKISDMIEFVFGCCKNKIHHTAIIHPDVTIGKNVKIGAYCIIGYDGFNFDRDKTGVLKLKNHTYSVVIEDDVEIHGNTCIDRGLYRDTIIKKGTKIDNLVHVGHDVIIGENNMIVAGIIIGGVVTIGKNNFIGIGVSIKPRVKIGDCNLIGMSAVVIKDIGNNEVWVGNPAKYLKDNLFFKSDYKIKPKRNLKEL